MPDKDLVYFDACVMLAYVKGEHDRVKAIRPLMEAAEREDIEIVTSIVSIVEVSSGAKQVDGTRTRVPAIEASIDSLWAPLGPIALVELYQYIANDARDLMRSAVDISRKLRPMDAIHLATAKRMEVSRLFTYDPDLSRWGPDIGVTVDTPRVPAFPEDSLFQGAPIDGGPSADPADAPAADADHPAT